MSSEVTKIEEKKEKESESKGNKNNKEDKIKQESEKDDEEKDIDEIKNETRKSILKRIKEQWQLILKILELVLCALCLGFFFEPAKKTTFPKQCVEQVALIFLAFTGYMLINAVFIVGRVLKDKIPFRISSLFSLIAAMLFFIAAILLIVDRKNKFLSATFEPHLYLTSMLSTSTVFCFINAVIFGFDGVYTFLLKEDF